MNEKLNHAIKLRESRQLEKSNSVLTELVQSFPTDAYINYQCAWSFDVMGEDQKRFLITKRQLNWGYLIGGIGLGFILSGIIYPLGYLDSYKVFTTMQMLGAFLIFCSLFIRETRKG